MIDKFSQFESRKSGKGPKGKDLTTFIRFGNLDHRNKQKGFGESGYHKPPAPRGFYAMPKVAQEMFLIGSIRHFQPQLPFPKNPWDEYYNPNTGEKLKEGKPSEEEQKEYNKRWNMVFWKIRREFKKKDGHLWHHLGHLCKPHQVISRHGSWVKTDMKTWRKAFTKSTLRERMESSGGKINIGLRGITGCYSRDHYEVFFDEKVNT